VRLTGANRTTRKKPCPGRCDSPTARRTSQPRRRPACVLVIAATTRGDPPRIARGRGDSPACREAPHDARECLGGGAWFVERTFAWSINSDASASATTKGRHPRGLPLTRVLMICWHTLRKTWVTRNLAADRASGNGFGGTTMTRHAHLRFCSFRLPCAQLDCTRFFPAYRQVGRREVCPPVTRSGSDDRDHNPRVARENAKLTPEHWRGSRNHHARWRVAKASARRFWQTRARAMRRCAASRVSLDQPTSADGFLDVGSGHPARGGKVQILTTNPRHDVTDGCLAHVGPGAASRLAPGQRLGPYRSNDCSDVARGEVRGRAPRARRRIAPEGLESGFERCHGSRAISARRPARAAVSHPHPSTSMAARKSREYCDRDGLFARWGMKTESRKRDHSAS